jgi:hypothetical protein
MRNRTAALTVAGLIAAVTLALGTGVASAQYNTNPTIAVPSQNGNTVTVVVTGFKAGSTVEFSYSTSGSGGGASAVVRAATGSLGSAVADASGTATLTATLPAGITGAVTITATGINPEGAPISVSTVVNLGGSSGGTGTTSGTGSESGLAFTGSNSSSVLLRAGVLALLLGAVAVFLARRNTAHDAA